MGIFDDILKGLPANANLREKISEAEAKQAALETENAILKDDNRKLTLERQQLQDEINRLTHSADLDEIKIQTLAALAQHGQSLYKSDLQARLQLQRTHIDYHVQELIDQGYLKMYNPRPGRMRTYGLTQKGRDYVIKNNLA